MNVLFLDAYYEPEQTAFTHLENDLIEGLVKEGHRVHIVCPIPTRGVSPEIAKKYANIKHQSRFKGKVKIDRFWAPQEGKNPILRAFRYFWCNLRTYQIGKKAKDVDVVFSNSTPPTQGWIAGKVARKLNTPFVYSLQDVFPDSLVNAKMTKENSLIWTIGRKIENKTYSFANMIITISDGFRENMIKKGVDQNKIIVIPNWIDTSKVYDIPRIQNKIIRKYNLDYEKFYICYSGNIGHSQNFELLIEVAEEIYQMTNQIEFVIIGDGAAKEQIENLLKRKGIVNVHLLPYQPYEDIAHVFSLGDVGLIISKPGIGGSSVPSKTWSIMAAHRPVLASFDREGELSNIIRNLNCGIIVNSGDKDRLIDSILFMNNNRNKLKNYSDSGYNYVSTIIEKNKCVKEYIEQFKNFI